MGFFKATGKLVGRIINDKLRDNAKKKSSAKAYQQTGEEIKRAKRRGQRVNGKDLYRRNLNKNNAKIDQRHNNVDKFIGDI